MGTWHERPRRTSAQDARRGLREKVGSGEPAGRSGLLRLFAVTVVFGAAAQLEHASAEDLPYFAAGAAALLAGLIALRLR